MVLHLSLDIIEEDYNIESTEHGFRNFGFLDRQFVDVQANQK